MELTDASCPASNQTGERGQQKCGPPGRDILSQRQRICNGNVYLLWSLLRSWEDEKMLWVSA